LSDLVELALQPPVAAGPLVAGGTQQGLCAVVAGGDPLPVSLAAPFALACLRPLQQALADPAPLELGGDHGQRSWPAHNAVRDDPTVGFDHSRVGSENKLSSTPLVSQVVERVIRHA
jgi:hypothetical protein